MDRADMYETLVAGPDAVSRRAHIQMQSDQELPNASAETDAILLRLGFGLGGPSPYRKGFRKAVLPEGWKIKPSDHYMYSWVIDEKGRRRAQIGYKAQDNWVSFHLERRFSPSFAKDDEGESEDDKGATVVAVIQDSDRKEVWRGPTVPEVDKKKNPRWFEQPTALDVACKLAEEKLVQIAPDWKNVEAYWGEDGDKIVWPAHETPVDTRETYTLQTANYDAHGNYRDGGVHATRKAKDDIEAKKKLMPALKWLAGIYREVRWKILCGDRVAAEGVETKPQEPRRMKGGRIFFSRDGRTVDFESGYGDES